MRHLLLLLLLAGVTAGEITIPPGATAVGTLMHGLVIPATKADLQTPVLVELDAVTVIDTTGKPFTLAPACRAQGVVRVDATAVRVHLELQRLVWVAPNGQLHEVPVTAYVIDATTTPRHGLPGTWKTNLDQLLTLPPGASPEAQKAIAKDIEPTIEVAAQRFTAVFLQKPMKLELGDTRPVSATVAAGSYPGATLIGGIELSDRQMTPVLIEMLLPLTTPTGESFTQACRITAQATAVDGRVRIQTLRLATLRADGTFAAGELYGSFTGAEKQVTNAAVSPTAPSGVTVQVPSQTALTLVVEQPASLR